MATLPDRIAVSRRADGGYTLRQPCFNFRIATKHSFAYFLGPYSCPLRSFPRSVFSVKSVNHNSAPSGYGIAAFALIASWFVLCAPWLFGDVSIPKIDGRQLR